MTICVGGYITHHYLHPPAPVYTVNLPTLQPAPTPPSQQQELGLQDVEEGDEEPQAEAAVPSSTTNFVAVSSVSARVAWQQAGGSTRTLSPPPSCLQAWLASLST